MRFLWHKRAEQAFRAAEQAKANYEQTLAERPAVERAARELRRQRELNGWTATIVNITRGGT